MTVYVSHFTIFGETSYMTGVHDTLEKALAYAYNHYKRFIETTPYFKHEDHDCWVEEWVVNEGVLNAWHYYGDRREWKANIGETISQKD